MAEKKAYIFTAKEPLFIITAKSEEEAIEIAEERLEMGKPTLYIDDLTWWEA